MNKIGLNDIREAYLSFFESKDHLRLPSFSLVPKDDNSLLLINAGMAPLKPYFTGLKKPPKSRVTTCQKCIRTGDIENVGVTSRHATFFEMLGNFSFGDYFKEEIIPWSWEFVTEVLNLPKDKLYVTIYKDDDEALRIWTESTDIDSSRIFKLGKDENFWEIGQGPCGPCSEIHFNRGNEKIDTVEQFIKASDEDNVVEFWNLVFTQFDKDENGNYNKLDHPNIDTGMGLERVATIMQEVDSIFEVDTMKNILNEVSAISGVKYGEDPKKDASVRIITDHVRSITFMISDGILPSNEGRGYVLRRLLRRAARHGKLLGIDDIFLHNLCDIVIDDYGDHYSELIDKKDYIKKIIKLEEERFAKTIDSGIHILEEYFDELIKNNKKVLSGEKAFKLYDTFGFPIELTCEILEEKEMSVDIDGFNKEMEDQRNRARQARDETNYSGSEYSIIDEIPTDMETVFDGYKNTKISSKVNTIIEDNKFVDSIKEGRSAVLVTEITPFYPEMGGQRGDTGVISNEKFRANVIDTKKNRFGKIIHFIKVTEGELKTGDTVILEIDKNRRLDISRHHTATHMLNESLREVLGTHVHQTGSYVHEDRLRFDFNHFSAMTEEEIKKVEELVNKKAMESLDIKTNIMKLDEAQKSGAISLLNEDYSDDVRVVSVGDFSKELCGGTHICNSGGIGLFKIISEYGIASGIRRIEAVSGLKSLKYINKQSNLIENIQNTLKCSEDEIINKIESQAAEIKNKDKQILSLKSKLAVSSEDDILNSVKEVKGVKFVTGILKDADSNTLRDLGDRLKDKLGDGLVVLGSTHNNKVQFVSMATESAVSKGVHCGKIIKQVASITGGNGGGRPNMAQAGGKDPLKLEEAISSVEKILEELL